MKEEIIKMFAKNISYDLQDIIIVGLNEDKEDMPICTACINFIYELKEKGINAYIEYFSDSLREFIYNEIKKYIGR